LERETSKPKSVGATLARFGSYFKPYWPQLRLVVAFMVAGTWAQVTAPDLIGQAVDCYHRPSRRSSQTVRISRAAVSRCRQSDDQLPLSRVAGDHEC
jgi:ATP-binding cassette subfamily B protein